MGYPADAQTPKSRALRTALDAQAKRRRSAIVAAFTRPSLWKIFQTEAVVQRMYCSQLLCADRPELRHINWIHNHDSRKEN